MSEKKAALLAAGGGLLALAGALTTLNRMNKSSRSLLKGFERMQRMPDWNPDKLSKSTGKEWIRFLKGGSTDDHREIIRSYINYGDDIIGDTTGRLAFNARWAPETFKWARRQGRWWLPKEMRGPVPIESTNPAWNAMEAPGRLTHFRELGGSGKVRGLRHWLAESKTKSFKDFAGFSDNDKKLLTKLDDEIAELKRRGFKDDEAFEELLHRDWLEPHLSDMVINKSGPLNPWNPYAFMNQQFRVRERMDNMPFSPDSFANSNVVKTVAGAGALTAGAGGVSMYREATKPWYEKWGDKLDDWIS